MKAIPSSPLTVVIFSFGIRSEIGSWKFEGATLLTLAIKVAISAGNIDRILVATDHAIRGDEEIYFHPSVTFIRMPLMDSNHDDLYEILISIYPFLVRFMGISPGKFLGGRERGIVVLDLLCPLRKPSHITQAINVFVSQPPRLRRIDRRFHVMSVGVVQNHFHPFKIVKNGKDGNLLFFKQEGRRIYQRQQLEGHPFFYPNSAVNIFDESLVQDLKPMGNEILGCFIEDPMITIWKKQDIKLAEALKRSQSSCP